MKPILFYGVPSGCSFGSIVALEWLAIPYQLCRIDMPEVVSGDDYKRINPVAETPSLMTETGTVISESMAILNHLGARAGETGLAFSQGSDEFDRLNQMLGFLNTALFNAYAPLWFALEHGSQGEEKRALTGYGRVQAEKAHSDLEAMLGGKPWLLGGHRTLADAYFIGIARWNEYHDLVDRRDYPGLQRLYEKLTADPAVVFAHAIEQGRPAVSAGGFAGEVGLDDALARLQEAA